MKSIILLNYLRIFHYIAEKRLENKDLSDKCIHAHLVTVLATGLLMWAYAILALLTISSPIPGFVGVLASTIHMLSPLLYRYGNTYFFFSNIFIASGFVHQGTFAFYTGGFDSNILIWFGILPLISGVIAGRIGAIFWSCITSLTVFLFFLLKIFGYQFPMKISDLGQVISQGFILFGLIFLSTVIILVYLVLEEQNLNELKQSRKRTQNLINILSHDISNPLTIIVLKLKYLSMSSLDELQVKLVGEAYKATERVIKISENIKELRLTELRKKEMTYAKIDLKDLLLKLEEGHFEWLEQKNIAFKWSTPTEISSFISNRSVLDQILDNLLSNAIKYSLIDGEIRLKVLRNEQGIEFLLEDDGIGIPKEMQANIFEASLSKSCPGTNGELGTGFGLPIVKGCVDMLNGKISFESKTSLEGVSGTSFKLFIPSRP